MNPKIERLTVLRLLLGGISVGIVLLTVDFYRQIRALGVVFSATSQMYWLLFGLTALCVMHLVILALTWTKTQQQLLAIGGKVTTRLPESKALCAGALVVLIGGYALVVLAPINGLFNLDSLRLLLFSWVVVAATVLFRRVQPGMNWVNTLAAATLATGFVYRLFQFLPDISLDPFSLGWSEASRFYYASLFFSEKIYGFQVPPSTLHPTRYLMQAVPFLINGLPLWFHRVWQVLLWTGFSLGAGYLLARRLKIRGGAVLIAFLAWVFLFMWQGPIYYHLLVVVMIVLWGFNSRRFWQSLIIVGIASAWAGISRVNWFPVPGMLATALYLLEKPQEDEALWRYLLPPAVWCLAGFGIAVGAQSLYIVWSGNDPEQFASSFSSALLWYRLFPNATFRLGVLTGVVLITIPLGWVILRRFRSGYRIPLINSLGLAAILGVLLAGGLVVSVKIGGGSNLHNLDAYLALLLVIGCYFYFQGRSSAGEGQSNTALPAVLNFVLVLIPVLITLGTSSKFVQYNPVTAADSLFKLQRNIIRSQKDGGEVLFISERQLLTFDYIQGVELVPEYEKVFLMEMVMSGNRTYLDEFERDIQNQRFDLIITDPLFESYKIPGQNWAEENNVWVDAVSVPVLCNYFRKVTFPESGVQILAPRENPVDCETLFDPEK